MSYNSSTGTTKNYFDGFGDVTMSVNADNQTSLSYYDNDGDLTAYVDPSHTTTSYKYDTAGQPTQTINPLGTTFTSYDDNGNVTQLVDADGRTTAMTYDSDDRLLSNADGSFAYNADGEMTSASNASGTYLMQYDPEGQVTSVSEPFGVSLNFAYDSQGNRTLVTDSLGGTQSSVYDLDNRLTTLTYSGQSQSLSETLSYYPGGEVSTAALYSGASLIATENYGIGGNDQVTSLVDHFASGTTLAVYDYAYNSLNDLTQTIQNGTTTAYSYDAAGELTGAGTASYAYDGNGNPTNLASTDLTGTDNELTQFVDPNTGDTWTYGYDDVGNRTQAVDAGASLTTTWNYAYDNANHMTSATETIGGTAVQTSAYQYDAFGKLIQETVTKTGSTAILRYAVDAWNPANAGATGVAGDTDWAVLDGTNSNALITRQLMSVGTQAGMQTTPLMRIDESGAQDGGGVFYTLTDRMGSVSEVLNNTPNATPVDQVEYDAYGNMIQTGSMYLGAYSWDSYDYDTAMAMNNNNARVYDPVSQRWMSQDPMGFDAGDSNLYRYVNNAPTGGTDPSGFLPGTSRGCIKLTDSNNHTVQLKSYYPPDPGLVGKETPDYRTVVQQGNDCCFAAVVVSLAKQRPQDIANMIENNGDGTYSVKLPAEKMPIIVNIQKAQAALNEKEAYSYSAGSPWLTALEIAVGQYWSPLKGGKYTRAQYIAMQGPKFSAGTTIKALTGHGWETKDTFETEVKLEKAIKAAIDNKKVICALTWGIFTNNRNKTGIESVHWYAIIGYKDGMVQLFNPWGKNTAVFDGGKIRGDGGPAFWINIKDFRKIYKQIDYED